jgi:hypothetical protein
MIAESRGAPFGCGANARALRAALDHHASRQQSAQWRMVLRQSSRQPTAKYATSNAGAMKGAASLISERVAHWRRVRPGDKTPPGSASSGAVVLLGTQARDAEVWRQTVTPHYEARAP